MVRRWMWVMAAGCGAFAGCGTASGPATEDAGTIRGVVVFNGQPLAGGLIVFSPDPERGGRGPSLRATVAADGSYCIRPDPAADLPAGWYRVAIAPPPQWRCDPHGQVLPFPWHLTRPDTSGLYREVRPHHTNLFSFSIELVDASSRP